jgi:hypothetical protein
MSTFTYYGGPSARSGKIHPLKASTFDELVRKYFDVPVPIGMERAEFLALPKTERDHIKDGPCVTSCTFKPGETKRCDANADKLVLACLDLDPPDVDFDEPDYVSDFWQCPECIGEALAPLNYLAYATANHTPERPRLRIIVPLTPCDPIHRRKIIRHLADRLGLPHDFKGVVESTVLSQPAYRPVIFKDEDNSTPRLLAVRTSGVDLDHQSIEEIPETPDQRTYSAGGDDDIGLDNLPAYGLTVDEIREPLFAIDPDSGGYKRWTEVASALRHQFRREDEARQAYELFDEWSSQGAKYKGEKETFSKWRSFKPDPTGKRPVTISTLYHHAKQAGWKPEKATEELGEKLEEWIAAQDDPKLLGREGPARIAAFPIRDAITEARLLDTFRSRLKELGAPITATTANKALKQARTVARVESNKKELPGWLRPWVFVSTDGEFVNKASGVRLTPTNFNLTYSVRLMSDEKDNELAKIGLPLVNPDKFALNVQAIDRVDSTMYDPRPDTPSIFEYKGVKYLNEYRADTTPTETSVGSERALRVFEQMVKNVFGEVWELAMQFFAHLVQRPGHKIRWCFCVQSGEGAGKSQIASMVGAAIGESNVIAIEPNLIRSDFDDWKYGKQLIVFEEIYVAGENRAAIMDKLKTLVTNSEVTMNRKNRDARKILNFANCIAYTNHEGALYMTESDRRYAPVRSPIQTAADRDRLRASGIFEEAADIIHNHAGALRHALLGYPIPDSFPVNDAPRTKYRREMIEASKNRLQIAIEDLIESSNPLIGPDVILASEVTRLTVEESKNNHKPAHYLAVLGYERYQEGRRFVFNGTRSAIWVHRDNYDPGIIAAEELLEMRLAESIDYL